MDPANLSIYGKWVTPADLKKCTTRELWVEFYVGQNEDYSPGDSISESSEKLLQRSKGECQYIWNSGEGEVHAIKHFFFFFLQVSASQEEQMSPWSAFLDMRRYKNWAHKISSWEYLTLWRPVLPVFPSSTERLISALHPELLSRVLKISSCSSTWINPYRWRWQGPMAGANL